MNHAECHKCRQGTPWYKQRLYQVFIAAALFLLATANIQFLRPVFDAFIGYVKLIWWAVVLGFLIGGLIEYYVPGIYVQKYLSRHKKITIVYSALLGFLMSACSHGILAISMQLYKKGAYTSSVIAFLLASPWANMPVTILLFGFFGVKALFLVGSALVIAVNTGLIYQVLEKNGMVECAAYRAKSSIKGSIKVSRNEIDIEKFSIWNDIKKRWKLYKLTGEQWVEDIEGVSRGAFELMKMVLWWILIGMIIASLARAFVPHEFFMNYMGPTLLGLIITLLLATIIEVCSEGSSPMAFEIYQQTNAFGNSFVFLLAGVSTDYTEIGLIWSNIGRRAAIWLPIITVPQIVLLGWVFNLML